MKQYNRAKDKRLYLTSIIDYTSLSVMDEEADADGKSEGKALCGNRKNNGGRGNQPGRGSEKNWRREAKYQSAHAGQDSGECRLSLEDSGEHRFGCGPENPAQEIGDAA